MVPRVAERRASACPSVGRPSHVLVAFLFTLGAMAPVLAADAAAPPPAEFQEPHAPAATALDTLTLDLQPGSEGKDTYGYAMSPGTNYGNSVWFGGIGLPTIGAGYSEWDLSALPTGAEVVSAEISLWAEYRDGTIDFSPVIDPWDEMTVTWQNQPQATTPTLAYPVARTQACYWGCVWTFDITEIVRLWVADPAQYHGLKISGNTPGIGWIVASSDNVTYPKPRLTLRYLDMQAPARARTWGELKLHYR